MKEDGLIRREEDGLLRIQEDEGGREQEEERSEEIVGKQKDKGWREEMEAFNYIENTENNKKIEENYSIKYVNEKKFKH